MAEPAPPRERAEDFIEAHATALLDADTPLRLGAEAATITSALAVSDPEAWDCFRREVVAEVIATRLRSHLGRLRHAAVRHERVAGRRAAFTRLHGDTVSALDAGQEPPSVFDARYALPGTNDWLRLGDMRRPELLAVARHRRGLANANGIEAVFLQALAERLPDDDTTVDEAVSAEDVVALHDKAEATVTTTEGTDR